MRLFKLITDSFYKIQALFKRREKLLWYFCSFETFVNIFQSGNIWLTDVVKSNDEFELKLCNAIANRINEKYNKAISKGKNVKELIKEQFILNDLVTSACSPNLVWTFCMTKRTEYLWQWVEYANKLSGVAIGFDYYKLKHKIDVLNKENDTLFFDLSEIKYMNRIPKNKINRIADATIKSYKLKRPHQEILNMILRFTGKRKVNVFKTEEEVRIMAFNKISQNIYSILHKDPVYQGYENPRAVGCHVLYDKKCQTFAVKEASSNVRFNCKARKDNIVSHIECKMDLFDLVKRIKYCEGHGNKKDIENILNCLTHNNKIVVEPQKMPYAREN